MKQLLTHMVKEGTPSITHRRRSTKPAGQAIAEPPKQTSRYLLYWRKPEEWGTLIYDWITENGLGGSIMTFYEITDGDLSFSTGMSHHEWSE
jgi:ESCRT-II complex subunit VPS25